MPCRRWSEQVAQDLAVPVSEARSSAGIGTARPDRHVHHPTHPRFDGFQRGARSMLAYACELAEQLTAELHLLHASP